MLETIRFWKNMCQLPLIYFLSNLLDSLNLRVDKVNESKDSP